MENFVSCILRAQISCLKSTLLDLRLRSKLNSTQNNAIFTLRIAQLCKINAKFTADPCKICAYKHQNYIRFALRNAKLCKINVKFGAILCNIYA